ncbi:MAG: thiamine pyrophosphate-dependent dehydrogenase E1 component subunit alpha [Thermoleophilaceae bacterium]|nr:thiamine pyrophosphate-dependent dehydrogenase E1 component subunit alpha [Thermoleophilaceae bacterium]
MTTAVDGRLDQETLVGLFERMLLIRRFEERASEYRLAGHIPGFLHPCIGQEAAAVGTCAALGPDDVILSTHRGHGHMLARGADPGRMYAELYARVEGYNRSKGGSLHMIDTDLGFLGANGIVGGGIPIAGGAALQQKRRGQGGVAVSFFGDGAANQGAFHEVLNLCSLWKLPAIFVCENNLYGEFTAQSEQSPVADVADRAAAYAMPGVIADGNDVLDVREKVAQAVARARAGEGPTLVECKTYRHRGHYEGDMCAYRPEGELEQWLERDPLVTFPARLVSEFGVPEEEIEAVRAQVEQRLDEAAEFAAAGTFADPAETFEHVYVDSIEGKALR